MKEPSRPDLLVFKTWEVSVTEWPESHYFTDCRCTTLVA